MVKKLDLEIYGMVLCPCIPVPAWYGTYMYVYVDVGYRCKCFAQRRSRYGTWTAAKYNTVWYRYCA